MEEVPELRIVVTGGAGFIGSHLVDRLLAHGHSVVVVDSFLTGRARNLVHVQGHPRLEIVRHDTSCPFDSAVLDQGFDRVYNLASPASPRSYGRYPIETLAVNSLGVFHTLELARRDGARFLQASTSEVYGDPLVHPQSEEYWGNVNPVGPRACYDESKRFAESLVTEYQWQRDVDTRIARIFNTYGPRSDPQDGRVVPNFCVQALRGEPLTVYGDGSQTRSFCYVDDLVRGLMWLMESDQASGEVVNLGNPTECTVLEFAQKILRLTGSSSPIIYSPLPVDDPVRRRPDISKAGYLLGWSPEVGLEEGLARTLEYFEQLLALPVRT